MDDTRRKLLLAHRELLKDKPYDAHGCRYEIIGSMFLLFGDDEEKVMSGMVQLGEDMAELGMRMSSYPKRPDLLCIMEENDALRPDKAV